MLLKKNAWKSSKRIIVDVNEKDQCSKYMSLESIVTTQSRLATIEAYGKKASNKGHHTT